MCLLMTPAPTTNTIDWPALLTFANKRPEWESYKSRSFPVPCSRPTSIPCCLPPKGHMVCGQHRESINSFVCLVCTTSTALVFRGRRGRTPRSSTRMIYRADHSPSIGYSSRADGETPSPSVIRWNESGCTFASLVTDPRGLRIACRISSAQPRRPEEQPQPWPPSWREHKTISRLLSLINNWLNCCYFYISVSPVFCIIYLFPRKVIYELNSNLVANPLSKCISL